MHEKSEQLGRSDQWKTTTCHTFEVIITLSSFLLIEDVTHNEMKMEVTKILILCFVLLYTAWVPCVQYKREATKKVYRKGVAALNRVERRENAC